MPTNPPFNPYATTQASGLFNSDTTGAVQGLTMADPATRYRLSMGYVDQNETLPLWGGVAVSEHVGSIPGMSASVNAGQSPNNGRMGNALKRATSASDLTGFALYDHSNHMVITPQSRAPQAFPGNSIGFARLGSNVRVPVPADPALRNQIGQNTGASLGWDFQNQRLIAGSSGATIPVRLLEIYQTRGLLVQYDEKTGALNWVRSEDPTATSVLALIQL